MTVPVRKSYKMDQGRTGDWGAQGFKLICSPVVKGINNNKKQECPRGSVWDYTTLTYRAGCPPVFIHPNHCLNLYVSHHFTLPISHLIYPLTLQGLFLNKIQIDPKR